jgi:DNA polymerase III delta' subunit
MILEYKKQWDFLRNKFELAQLSHAYLFVGEAGIGKKDFAKEFIKLIACQAKENIPCQKCFSCQGIERGGFPDFKVISAANKKDHLFGDGGEIKISQIREAQNFLGYKSYYGAYKTVIVDGAEAMNPEAQNCFLKTLEEPKGKTVLFLITAKPDMLLTTILSRCQTLKFFKPKGFMKSAEELERRNKILRDLVRAVDSNFAEKFKYVKSIDFQQQDPGEIISAFQGYLRGLMLEKAGLEKFCEDSGAEVRSAVLKNCSVIKIKDIINLTEDINSKLVFSNANPKLALEILLMGI